MSKQFAYDALPLVQTKQGLLRGYQYDGTYIFKGIPYAKARRFHKPEAPDSWEGVREAASYGFVCPMLTRDNPQGELLAPHRYWPQDENCLNLNIWTQHLDGKRPVVVWLHGGGFTMGSSIEQKAYNGENLSRFGDLVVVSLNHRLNVLGYLDLAPYGAQYANSANAGQDDQIAALRWVRENIAAFGGDPDNVTIFGQSGGGMKVSCLMQMPEADGLFHKGVVMSGEMGETMPYSTGDPRPLVQALLAELGLGEDEVEKLETVPYPALAAAYNKVSLPIAMQGGYIGGTPKPNAFYKGQGPQYGFTDHAKTIPLIVGSVLGEFAMLPLPFDKRTVPAEVLDGVLAERFGGKAAELKALFAAAYPDKSPAELLTLDTVFRAPSMELVRAFAAAGGRVYSYLFTLEFPYQNAKTAWHCSDIPFVFHNAEMVPVCNMGEASDRLEAQMAGALAAFAETGDPNHSGLPHWPASTAEQEATLLLDRTCRVAVNHDHALVAAHIAASPKFDLMALMAVMANPDAGSTQVQH